MEFVLYFYILDNALTPEIDVQPFSWAPGTAVPTVNQFSWTNLSSVLWIEQPVGTGFSQGVPNIQVRKTTTSSQLPNWSQGYFITQGEEDLAVQLVGFLQQFLEVFSELKGKKFYLTGESVSSHSSNRHQRI